jgi:Fe-S cluster biosynthesis and repair protein YggX
MRKHFFDLQLFAEDPQGTDPQNQPAAQTGDSKPSNDPDPQSQEPANQPKYTDDDVNKLIDQKFAEWQKKQQKAIDEAKKLERMDAQQKAEYERDQLQKQIEEYQKKDTLSGMTKTARKMLSDEQISIPDELLDKLVTTDAEETKTAVDAFTKLFKESVQSAVKDALRGNAPKGGTGSNTAVTKDQILAIKDRVERQHMIAEHMDLFQ